MQNKKTDFEKTVLDALARIERRLTRVEIKTASLAATVAILVHFIFN